MTSAKYCDLMGIIPLSIIFYVLFQGPLPLDSSLLGERAMKCRAYAKALHYKEDEFHRGPKTQILESLIRSEL